TISAGPTDNVSLRGLLIDGAGTGGNGISFTTGLSLNVQDCMIRGFTAANPAGQGILFTPNASSKLIVANTVVVDNRSTGIDIEHTGSGTVTAVLERVLMANSHNSDGLFISGNGGGGSIRVIVSESVVTQNGNHGIVVTSTDASTAVLVRNSTIAHNTFN